MKKTVKILALVICAVLILGLAFSEAYITVNSHHICVGDSCAVCARLHTAGSIIEHLLGPAILMLLFCILALALVVRAYVGYAVIEYFTPVELRVRLNN